jgi:hypothetical protein
MTCRLCFKRQLSRSGLKNLNLSQCHIGHEESERSGWSHLEKAVVSPPRPVGVLGHPVGRVVVVVITHQHNSMVKLHLGILARPVHCLHIAEILEEGVEICNSRCGEWYDSNTNVFIIQKLLLVWQHLAK